MHPPGRIKYPERELRTELGAGGRGGVAAKKVESVRGGLGILVRTEGGVSRVGRSSSIKGAVADLTPAAACPSPSDATGDARTSASSKEGLDRLGSVMRSPGAMHRGGGLAI